MARFFAGQIVHALIHDGVSGRKVRPVVIIDRDVDDTFDSEILVISITKRQEEPCPDYHIKVHDSQKKDRTTGLNYPCWAKCNWPRLILFSDVRGRLGHLPQELLEKIADVYDRLCADDDFDDWQ